MDRDNNGSISRQELDCEEFQEILRSVIAPHKLGAGGATYSRSEMNLRQAMDFCLRKADFNNDGTLSFKEFKSFLRALRNQRDSKNTASLIFALFDLDMNGTVEQEEFREIYRYYAGRHPTTVEFEAAWAELDTSGGGQITKEQYIAWLSSSADPLFRQHAPAVEAESEPSEATATDPGGASSSRRRRDYLPAPGLLPFMYSEASSTHRPQWNDQFRGKDRALLNPALPSLRRTYFSRPQSLPELTRFFRVHRGFESQLQRLEAEEPPQGPGGLSSSPQGDLSPSRHVKGGTMRDVKGEVVPWRDDWVPPLASRRYMRDAGTKSLRCPGEPPDFLRFGRDAGKKPTT